MVHLVNKLGGAAQVKGGGVSSSQIKHIVIYTPCGHVND